jgi:uncharacterized membrane protein YedE/YeeE
MAALIVSLLLAAVLGFAAHRGSVCTVRAVAETMHARTFYMFASIGKSVLWIVAVTIPFFWLIPATATNLSGWPLTGAALAGGFLFGLGAGINGACAYSTMARLVDGEVGMLIAIAGFAVGVYVFIGLIDAGTFARPLATPALVAGAVNWAVLIALALVAVGVYEARRLWRTAPAGASVRELILARPYRLSTTALIMGVSGAAIFLLFGAGGYTSTFEVVVEGTLGTRPWPAAGRWLLLLAVLFGMFLSTLTRGGFRVDWRPRLGWLRNLFGGVLMGLGVAMAPGGNDVLVLYAIPSLSPHAIPVFAALAAGVAVALLFLRAVFGVETRAVCRDDVFISDWGLGTRAAK